MKLHDLQVGQRFTFTDKHRGKVFEVTSKYRFSVVYMDVATGQLRHTYANRKTFRTAYLLECDEENREDRKSAITALHLKLTGLPGRRVVLPNE
jgi:hypothetical protein